MRVIASDIKHPLHLMHLTPEKAQRRFDGLGRKIISWRYPGSKGGRKILGEKSPDIPSPNPLLCVTYVLPKSE
jgi:hypothetical protein